MNRYKILKNPNMKPVTSEDIEREEQLAHQFEKEKKKRKDEEKVLEIERKLIEFVEQEQRENRLPSDLGRPKGPPSLAPDWLNQI